MSAIEWTDKTWNPTTGCDRVSSGCDSCYALTLARRLKAMRNPKYQRDGDPRTSGPGFGLTVHEDTLSLPLKWRKPRRVFVNSMSDLFHDAVPDEFIARVWAVMAATPQHTYQILTKRHGRMRSLLLSVEFDLAVAEAWSRLDTAAGSLDGGDTTPPYPLPNCWLGVSVENQKHAELRIPALLETPAAVRFLSCEPLLGPVDLSVVMTRRGTLPVAPLEMHYDQRTAQGSHPISWVIVGGESGPKARPMHPDWARSLRDQCQAAGVSYFFKQWGEWAPSGAVGIGSTDRSHSIIVGPPVDDHGCGSELTRVGKKATGRELDGRTWDEFPVVTP